jgi:hypothetical protein
MKVLAYFVNHSRRFSGKTKSNTWKTARLSRDGCTQFTYIAETNAIRLLEALDGDQVDLLCSKIYKIPTQSDGNLRNGRTKLEKCIKVFAE